MASGPGFFYTLLDPYFFESLDRYRPGDEFLSIVEPHLSDAWTVNRGGFWTNVLPNAGPQLRRSGGRLHEGWKIHISSTVERGSDILSRIAPLVIRRRVGFKFCSDPRMLGLSLTKNWPRTGAGKFMTIYPADLDGFKALIQECHEATEGIVGPYILSDRPYRDSRTVFYRYGEHVSRGVVNAYGVRTPTLVSTDGRQFSDDRVAHYQLPEWVEDPFSSVPPPTPPGEDGVLLNDRYRVTMAIKFSSVGGIYQALDTLQDKDVIIREARPMLARVNTGYDAEQLLRKEARILQALGGTGLLPEFIDLFQEWEHSFLVQEKLEAESLWGYAMNFAFGDASTPVSMFDGIRETAREIIRGLTTIHEHRIVLRDMTRTNVLFTDEGQVKFIDLEFAYELDDSAPPVAGWTPGYASPDQLRNQKPRLEDDYYALGVLLLDMISFTAPGYGINREGMLRSLAMDLDDCRQPAGIIGIIEGLTHADAAERLTPAQASARFDALETPSDTTPLFPEGELPPPRPPPSDTLREEAAHTVDGAVEYIRNHADYTRDDRLWPASGEVFHTNAVHVQYGAAGTAYFLFQATGEVSEREVGWIVDHLGGRALPPGLMAGAGGVALLLCDVGETGHASALMDRARESADLLTLPDLYYGAAGWGIANLGLWARTRDPRFLEDAIAIGDELLGTAQEDDRGLSWEADGFVRLGYGEGQSGTATFFFYLYAATQHARFRDAGVRALEFDWSYGVDVRFGILWFPHIEAKPGDPKSPHIRFGTAGVGTAALRGFLATGEERFLEWARRCAYTVSRRYTNKLWHDYGMAGYMELLLDMYQVTNDTAYLHSAWHLAERLVLHRIETAEGVAYLGRDLMRISCDFAMGSAGIGVVLHRLLHPETPRLLLPDQLLRPAEATALAESGAGSPATAHTP